MKIKTRFQINTLLSIFVAFLIGSVLFWATTQINEETRRGRVFNEIVKGMNGLDNLIHEYLLHHTERARTQWESKYESLSRLLTVVEIKGPEEKVVLIKMQRNHENIKSIFNQLILTHEKKEGLDQEHIALYQEFENRLAGQLVMNLEGIIFDSLQLSQTSQAGIMKAQNRSVWFIIIFIMILATSIGIISFFLSRSIVKPITKLQEGTKLLGAGNLDFKVETSSKDEIGDLSGAFNQMVENLRTTTVSRDKLAREITERKQIEEALREKTYDLGERVKELGCLYGIFNLIQKPDISLDEIFQGVVEIIPPSWQYPEITCSRIIFEGDEHRSKGFIETTWKQSQDIFVHGNSVGSVEIYYFEEKPEIFEGPFLKEERDLINAIAESLGKIIERIQAEAQIKASLKEKEVLLGEVYHRVKNNMQLVASLLNLQAENVKEKQYADMFKESRDRVRSMASIHEKLYQSEDLANVDFEGYVKSFSNTLFRAYAADPNKIRLQLEIKDVSFGLKTAIPCGLLINELLTNSLKYAFPEGREGEIRISIRPVSEDTVGFIFSDNGVGIPEDLDIKKTDSFGMFLINVLAEDQLRGKIELDRTGGTKFVIELKRQE